MTDAATVTSSLFEHVASANEAVRHFRGRLGFETDVSDVWAELQRVESGEADRDDLGFVLIDTRNDASWAQGRVPGATHLPTRRIRDEAAATVAPGTPVVVYCWGPGCNGATRAALEFASLGHPVKEMIGGFEYWVREGFPVESASGRTQAVADPLTNVSTAALPDGGAPNGPISCAC
ncbi:rhodanese-like domain-containing protein [Agromyces sp. CFH 90414]|uniref:Rhodanese-like domain-containing protein n=1 Tax=Agromyces agglutinans TaxID=2662258 RepID=A0A6I2F7U0_9MICO|nr:rhodanese-like domain-containing protein [Agromyces agglutinans]MRG60852.1 rhodanese-like domain-containing protein [Agromyces agglutinans]